MSANGHARILVVEDDQDVRDTILDLLSDEGVPAAGTADGASALRFLRSAPVKPNLILLDLMMPGVNGLEFRRLQMEDPSLANIPVVLLSADVTTESTAGVMRAAGYLRKPVKLAHLLEVVQRYGAPEA
ncbi:MAG TPA: response regulator [Myxococcaceae bacterium]|nr:response regulator [Myxococcaceae bacterium]